MYKTMITVVTAWAITVSAVSPSLAAQGVDRGKAISFGEDGSVCYELDAKDGEAYVKKAEAAEKAGRLKEAFDAAVAPTPGCWGEASEHIAGIIERTYKRLGQEAEKAGRIYEAHKYFIYPFNHYIAPNYYRDRFEKNYSLSDAHRTMLAHAKANAGDYKVVEEAVRYFNIWHENRPPHYKEAVALAEHGGNRVLANEDKAFNARKFKNALENLEEAQRWFSLVDDERPVIARGKQRVDALLTQSSYDAIELADRYAGFTQFGDNNMTVGHAAVKARASKLGDEAERKGDLELASRFYGLSGESAKQNAVNARMTKMTEEKARKKEKAEVKRQEKFKQEQKALEDELGF